MAKEPQRFSVAKCSHLFHDPDRKVIEAKFEGDGDPVTLIAPPEAMAAMAVRISRFAREMMSKTNIDDDRVTVQTTSVDAFDASVPIGGPVVVLSFRSPAGHVEHFALTPDQSEQLRSEMEKAEPHARENRKIVVQ